MASCAALSFFTVESGEESGAGVARLALGAVFFPNRVEIAEKAPPSFFGVCGVMGVGVKWVGD